VVGKFIIGENSARNNIISHLQNFSGCDCVSSEIACQKSGHGLRSGSIA
jgi:hypothetical protein